MKILVYAFKPFLGRRENISEKVLGEIQRRPGLKRVTFPVRFDKAMLVKVLRKYKPDAVIGLGQCPANGRKMRIERKAVNSRKGVASILPRGPKYIPTTLRIKPSSLARFSYNAGEYVCNFSMYIIGNYCRKEAIPHAFLHIPTRFNSKVAARFVNGQINKMFTRTL